jgi:hypothetical protein
LDFNFILERGIIVANKEIGDGGKKHRRERSRHPIFSAYRCIAPLYCLLTSSPRMRTSRPRALVSLHSITRPSRPNSPLCLPEVWSVRLSSSVAHANMKWRHCLHDPPARIQNESIVAAHSSSPSPSPILPHQRQLSLCSSSPSSFIAIGTLLDLRKHWLLLG